MSVSRGELQLTGTSTYLSNLNQLGIMLEAHDTKALYTSCVVSFQCNSLKATLPMRTTLLMLRIAGCWSSLVCSHA